MDFNTAARTNPGFGDLSRQAAAGARGLVHRVLSRLDETGTLRPGRDIDIETERLTALLDGLGLGAVLHPDIVSPRMCVDALLAHLDDLASPMEAPDSAR
ncbi:TetR family transcriptional regulator C-terminal domain-containing protein [Streptomyces sp. M10(2022)]